MQKSFVMLLVAACAWAAPVIRTSSSAVVNAASYIPIGAAGTGLAQGCYFVIFGSGLGPANIAVANLPFPQNLAGTTVTVTPAKGSPVQAYLYYALDGQVSGILPSNTATGAATVTVTYNNVTSAPYNINVVSSHFGIFTMSQNGAGPGAILNLNSATSAPLNTFTNAAVPGQIMELFGTGLGPISGADNVAPGAVSPANIDVKVLVAGQSITPLYAGRSPQFPGLDQINFQIPSDSSVPDSCFVPVAIQVNGVVGNYATFAKTSSGTTCPAPLGLSAAGLQKLASGSKVNLGLLALSHENIQATVLGFQINAATEQAGGAFGSVDAAGLYSLVTTPGAMPPPNPPGTCLVQTLETTSVPTTPVPVFSTALNAGSQLTLTGPGGKTAPLPTELGGSYQAFLAQTGAVIAGFPISGIVPGIPAVPAGLPASFIETGTWSIAGGGSDVGTFKATVTAPTPLQCVTCSNLTSIDRSKPLTLNWTGGGSNQDYVQLGGIATTPSVADPKNTNVAVVFSCTARASDGTFTVPVSILSQLPTSSADATANNVGALAIVNGLGSSDGAFTAAGLDGGYFGYSSLLYQLMGFQ